MLHWSVNAKQLEDLVVGELKHITETQEIIDGIIEQAIAEQSSSAQDLREIRKALSDQVAQAQKKKKNLIDVVGTKGRKAPGVQAIMAEIELLDTQSSQLQQEIEHIDFQIDAAENEVFSAQVIRDNLRIFKDIFDELTSDEQYDLIHLLVKKIIYYEDKDQNPDGTKSGKIRMEFWELPELFNKKEVLWRVASSTPFLTLSKTIYHTFFPFSWFRLNHVTHLQVTYILVSNLPFGASSSSSL